MVTYPVSKLGSWSESELRFTDVVIPCGHIVSVSACEQRSLLVTCGLDNSVRVWFGQRTSPTLLPCSIYHAFDEVIMIDITINDLLCRYHHHDHMAAVLMVLIVTIRCSSASVRV